MKKFVQQCCVVGTAYLLSACAVGQDSPKRIDCSLPYTDTRINECTIVKRASDFTGCLRSSDIAEHTCLIMDEDVSFCDAEQTITLSALFNQSNKILDCAGGTIDHGWSAKSSQSIKRNRADKQMPYVRFFDDRSLKNIAIKNCTMRGSSHAAIQMTRFFGGELGGDGKLDKTESLPVGHSDVLFQDLNIEGGQVGMYLGNFSQDISINRVSIDGTERIAIYSEAGSHRIKITNSVISNNQTREAVAIDSTYNSEISNTQFINNAEGGINVYQNCGELKGTVCPVVRPTPSNGNKIIGNTFKNNGVTGIQIASRQGRRHSLGWCASLNGLPGKFTDTAINNVVANNTIECTDGKALVVMDGPNEIRDNKIVATNTCVPLEISTGGFSRGKNKILDGLVVEQNQIVSEKPPLLRNLSDNVKFDQ